MSTTSRDHSLDAARGILMGLGVLLHASNIYAPAGGWIIGDMQTHPFFDYLAQGLHVFRMPVFFWISGYFCCMSFIGLGPKALLQVRMPRLLLPLLATLLTLNVLQDLLVGWSKGLTTVRVLQAGLHLHHLWFLLYLVIFVALAAWVLPFCGKWLDRLKTAGPRGWPTIALALGLLSYTLELAVRQTGIAYDLLLGLVTPFGLTSYLPYFAAGAMMYAWQSGKAAFVSAPPWLMVPALAVAVGLAQLTPSLGGWQDEVVQLAHWLATWISVGTVLSLFEQLFKSETAFTRLVSDSAYTVYLFHHMLVVAVGMALISTAVPIGLKFLIVSVIAWTVGLAVHLLVIRRVRVLQWLFNGRGIDSMKPSQKT